MSSPSRQRTKLLFGEIDNVADDRDSRVRLFELWPLDVWPFRAVRYFDILDVHLLGLVDWTPVPGLPRKVDEPTVVANEVIVLTVSGLFHPSSQNHSRQLLRPFSI